MTQSALDAYALANGYGKVTQKMSEAEKVALRYYFVQDQLKLAAGDFARTSGSWANQVRLLSLQFDSLKASIGQGLINLFTPIIRAINTLLGKLVTLAAAFKSFTEFLTGQKGSDAGIKSTADAANAAKNGLVTASGAANKLGAATDAAGKKAKKAAKEMKQLFKFDEINRLDPPKKDNGSGDTPNVGGGLDFGKMPDAGTDKISEQLNGLKKRFQELAGLFSKGFKIGFGDFSVLKSMQKELKNIGKSLLNIFTDKEVLKASNRFVDRLVLNLGKAVGAVASIGATIGDNLLGGLEGYLQENSDNIKKYLINMFDVSGDISGLVGDLFVALADIFTVFRSPEAKQITTDLIKIFMDAFMNVSLLAFKFGRDLLKVIVKPITDNKDKLKLALQNTVNPISQATHTIAEGFGEMWKDLQETYDLHIKPLLDSVSRGLSEIVGTLTDGYNQHIAPVLSRLAEKFDKVWNESVQPMLKNFTESIGKLGDAIKRVWEENIQPTFNWIAEKVMPILAPIVEFLGGLLIDGIGAASDAISGLIDAFDGFVRLVEGISLLDFEDIFSGLGEILSGLGTAIVEGLGLDTVAEDVGNAVDDIITTVEDMFSPTVEWFSGLWTDIQGVFSGIGTWFSEKFSDAKKGVTDAFKGIGTWFGNRWTDIKKAFKGIKTWFSDKFSGAKKGVKDAFKGIGGWFGEKWTDIKNAFKGVGTWFSEKFNGALTGIKNVFNPIKKWFSGVWDSLKQTVSDVWDGILKLFQKGGKIFSGVKDGIAGVFKTIVNTLISGINKVISVPFNTINGMLNKIKNINIPVINKKPFDGLWKDNPLPVPQIPKLARGGMVSAPTLAMIGEAGKEAVLPLENNTQALDLIADKFIKALFSRIGNVPTGGSSNELINLIINLGDKKLIEELIDLSKMSKSRDGNIVLNVK